MKIGIIIGFMIVSLYAFALILGGYDFHENAERAKIKKLLREREEESSFRMEACLSQLKEIPSGDSTPVKNLLISDMEILGEWYESGGLGGSSLSIKRIDSLRFQIRFHTQGCLGSWFLKRTGIYRNGVLMLDQPVEEYLPRIYIDFYTVRIQDKEYLLPTVLTEELKKCLSEDNSVVVDSSRAKFCLYKRT